MEPQNRDPKSKLNFKYNYKIILIGDSGVGKTFLLERFVHEKIPTNSVPTIGLEFSKKVITLQNGKRLMTQIWDTAGQEKYRSIAKTLYRDADGAILMFDLTRRNTFENCATWLEEFKLGAKEGAELLVVGNKLDLIQADPDLRTVEKTEAEDFANYEGFSYMETSALTAKNVDAAFLNLLGSVHDKREKELESRAQSKSDNPADMSVLPMTLEENSAMRLDRQGIKSADDSNKLKNCC